MGQHYEFLMVDINSVLVKSIKTVPFTLRVTGFELLESLFLTNITDSAVFTDGLSLLLLWLTGVVCLSAQVFLLQDARESFSQQTVLLLFVAFLSACCFHTTDLLVFFIAFEVILLPLFFMIGLFGSRPEKVGGALFLLLYTLVGSLFLWPAVLYFVVVLKTTGFYDILDHHESIGTGVRTLLWWCFFVGFAFKVPVVPAHLWLTVAHVEAPTVGSMLLAGLILKLGGYGIIRFVCTLFPVESASFHTVVVGLCCLGYTWATVAATRQVDIKRFVAYTSISHMNFALAVLFSLKDLGFGAFCHTMLSHGVIAAGMFGLVGFIYKQTASRDIVHLSGLGSIAPLFAVYWFIFSMANVGLPFFSGFPGEFYGLTALASEGRFGVFCFFLGFYLSAVYAFVSVSRLLYGSSRSVSSEVCDLSTLSQQSFSLLGGLSVLLGLLPNAVFVLAPLSSSSSVSCVPQTSSYVTQGRNVHFVDKTFTNYLDDHFGLPETPAEIFGTNWIYRELAYFPYTAYTMNPYASVDPEILSRIDGVLDGPDCSALSDYMEDRPKNYVNEMEQGIHALSSALDALKHLSYPLRFGCEKYRVSSDALYRKEVSRLISSTAALDEAIRPMQTVETIGNISGYLHRMTFHAGPGTYHPIRDASSLKDHNGEYRHTQLNNRQMWMRRSWTGPQPINSHLQFFVVGEDRVYLDKQSRMSQSPLWFRPKVTGLETHVLRFSPEYSYWYDMETGQIIPRLGREKLPPALDYVSARNWISHLHGSEHVRIVDYRGRAEYFVRATAQHDPIYTLLDRGLMFSAAHFDQK